MNIKINGKQDEIDDTITISKLIEKYNYHNRSIAVAINQEFIPHVKYNEIVIHEDDDIEFVAPMAGG